MNDAQFVPCAEWEEILASIHSRDLSPAEREKLNAHVASCPACAVVLADYFRLDALLHQSLKSERILAVEDIFSLYEMKKNTEYSLMLQGSRNKEVPSQTTVILQEKPPFGEQEDNEHTSQQRLADDGNKWRDEDLLTIHEVARRLRVDDTTVRRWIVSGALEAITLPHRGKRQAYRIHRSILDSLLAPTQEHAYKQAPPTSLRKDE